MSYIEASPSRVKCLTTTLLTALALSVPVQAAVQDPGLRVNPNVLEHDYLGLTLMGQGMDDTRLDWRTPERALSFTLPPSDWVETLTLHLSADPLANTRARTIDVRLNGGQPTRLALSAKGFDARMPLPTDDLRSGRNVVTLSLPPADGACLVAGDGGWDVDLKTSKLSATVRAKSRSVFLSELEDMFSRPRVKPMQVGIRAHGTESGALEALIAQGAALRTKQTPQYALGGSGEVTIMAGTRLALTGQVRDTAIMEASGARIAVDEGRPLRLILTGDTEAEVRDAVNAFATHRLPDARLRITTPAGLRFASKLGGERETAGRRTKIGELGGLDFSANWGAGVDAVRFDVKDPEAASARVRLDLERAEFVSAASSVDVELNGRPLGRTVLDSDKVTVDFAVPQGWLQGRDNQLRVIPDLLPTAPGCAPDVKAAGLLIGPKSMIDIRTPLASSDTDLARLASDGGRLAAKRGEGTHVVLPKGRGERSDALRILGRMAEASGSGLTEASYSTEAVKDRDLVTFARLPETVDAPRTLRLAMQSRDATVGLFPEDGRWVGVFAPARGRTLGTVADQLAGPAWNDLSGGIARIEESSAERVQMAFADPSGDTDAPSVTTAELFTEMNLGEIADAVSAEFADGLDNLSAAWSNVEIRLPKLPVARFALRGRYDAPKAVESVPGYRYTLADDDGRLSMGFASDKKAQWKRFKARSARKAAALRKETGLQKVTAASWDWADRNMSLAALLVMLSFTVACLGLTRSEWQGR